MRRIDKIRQRQVDAGQAQMYLWTYTLFDMAAVNMGPVGLRGRPGWPWEQCCPSGGMRAGRS